MSNYDTIRRRANQRLRRLRSKNPDSPALKAAERYIGKGGLYTPEKDPIKRNRQEQEINRFLKMKTSTATGIKELDAENRRILQNAGVESENVDTVFEILKDDIWRELKMLYDSSEALNMIDELVSEGIDGDKILEILRNAQSRVASDSEYKEALKNARDRGFDIRG